MDGEREEGEGERKRKVDVYVCTTSTQGPQGIHAHRGGATIFSIDLVEL